MPREGKGSNVTLGSFLNRGSTSPCKPFWDYTHNTFYFTMVYNKAQPWETGQPIYHFS